MLIILVIEAFLLHKLPQSLDQIKIGRVRWEEENLNIQTGSNLGNVFTSLISSIIHDECDRNFETKSSNFFKKLSNTYRVNIAIIGHHDELMRDSVECS